MNKYYSLDKHMDMPEQTLQSREYDFSSLEYVGGVSCENICDTAHGSISDLINIVLQHFCMFAFGCYFIDYFQSSLLL